MAAANSNRQGAHCGRTGRQTRAWSRWDSCYHRNSRGHFRPVEDWSENGMINGTLKSIGWRSRIHTLKVKKQSDKLLSSSRLPNRRQRGYLLSSLVKSQQDSSAVPKWFPHWWTPPWNLALPWSRSVRRTLMAFEPSDTRCTCPSSPTCLESCWRSSALGWQAFLAQRPNADGCL